MISPPQDPVVPEPWTPVAPETIGNDITTDLSFTDNEAMYDYGKLGNHSGLLVSDEPRDVDNGLDHDHEGLPLFLSHQPAMLVFRAVREIYHNNLENKLGDQGYSAPANYSESGYELCILTI